MQARIAECGMRAARHLLVTRATSRDEIVSFLGSISRADAPSDAVVLPEVASAEASALRLGFGESRVRHLAPTARLRAVVKPLASCGSDGVSFVTSVEHACDACDAIVGRTNKLGEANAGAVIEEFINGTEFVVDR